MFTKMKRSFFLLTCAKYFRCRIVIVGGS